MSLAHSEDICGGTEKRETCQDRWGAAHYETGAIFLQICTRLLLAVWSEDRDKQQKTDVILVGQGCETSSSWVECQQSSPKSACMKFPQIRSSRTTNYQRQTLEIMVGPPTPPPRNLPYPSQIRPYWRAMMKFIWRLLSSQIQPKKYLCLIGWSTFSKRLVEDPGGTPCFHGVMELENTVLSRTSVHEVARF